MTGSGQNRIVVDWDGTCVDIKWPEMGDWKPHAIYALRTFLKLGFEVVIHSTRFSKMDVDEVTPYELHEATVAQVRRMLDDVGLQEVEIWLRPWKPGGIVYIDDKAIEFTTWPNVMERLTLGGKLSAQTELLR